MMTEQNYKESKNIQPQPVGKNAGDELDAVGKSLSDALRVSFIILEIIMIVLLGLFLLSGFETIGSDEQGLVLRFGRIRGEGEERILKPGLVGPLPWLGMVFPYPIDKVVKIPVAKKTNLAVNSFWYYQKKTELLPGSPQDRREIGDSLDPITDGYCLTRNEKESQRIAGSTGSDYNIVHCKWQVTYQIDDPERFFRNIYTDDPQPGQSYADAIEGSINPLLKMLFDSSVVTVMVNYTIDEARSSDERIARDVKKLLQEKLDTIESGMKVVSAQLNQITWPRQVDYSFLAFISASQASDQVISEAKLYAEKTLSETAGPAAEKLLSAIEDETMDPQQKELLWSQLAGSAQDKIAQAKAYQIKVVETAKANAEYLKLVLPEYRKHPKLVIQKIYQDAIEYVLENADEKMIIQPSEGTGGREIRVLINRDPSLKPKSKQ